MKTILTVGLLGCSLACQTFGASRKALPASLRTDSSEIGVDFRMNAYIARIGFTLVNDTGGPITRLGCGGPGMPSMEKNVDGRWIYMYSMGQLACLIKPDFVMENGATHRGVLYFMAYKPKQSGPKQFPELLVDSVDGNYRLRWRFTAGRDAEAKYARKVEAISNEFRMILRPASTR